MEVGPEGLVLPPDAQEMSNHQQEHNPYFLAGRAAGKTYVLIEWLCKDIERRRIIVADSRRAELTERAILRYLEEHELKLPPWYLTDRPYHVRRDHLAITPHELTEGRGRNGRKQMQYAIDDLNAVLWTLLRADVYRVTDTGMVVTSQAEWREHQLDR